MRTKKGTNALTLAQRIARKKGISPRNARPAELVLVKRLSTTKESYKFSLKDEDQTLGIAKGLKDRNGFLATHMAIGVTKAPIRNTNEYLGANPVLFYPDPNVFGVAATTDIDEAEALEHIYSTGRYTLKTNQGTRIDAETCRHFRTVLETQGGASTTNMQTGEELKQLGAAVIFGGGDNNEVIIEFDCEDKTDIDADATSNNYLVVVLSGAIIHGSTTKLYTS